MCVCLSREDLCVKRKREASIRRKKAASREDNNKREEGAELLFSIRMRRVLTIRRRGRVERERGEKE